MDTNNGQAEAAPTSDQPTASAAPANAESSTTDTISSSQPQPETAADANAELRAFYDGKPPAEGVDAGETEEQVQTTDDKGNPPAAEPPKIKDKAPEVETPADDPKAPEAPEQMRPRLHDPQDIAVASLAKAKGITLVKAAAIIAAADTPASPIPGTEASAEPSPVQKLEADVAKLATEIEAAEAGDDYLKPDHLKKVRQLATLESDLRIARLEERQLHERTTSETHSVIEQNKAAVRRDYPDIANEQTVLGKHAAAVVNEWSTNPDLQARLNRPNAPQAVAAEAAERAATELFDQGKFATIDLARASLKAAPAAATKAPVPPSSQQPTPQPPAQRRVTPASGSKSQIPTGNPSTLGEVFASVETAAQGNDALLNVFGGPSKGQRRGS